MTATYDCIATTTLSSAQTSINFNSIPGTYTDLIVVAYTKITSGPGENLRLQFNGNTGTSYSALALTGTGVVAASNANANQTVIDAYSLSATEFVVSTWHIMNYANTTTNKTVLVRLSRPDAQTNATNVNATVGLYRSTSAITSLTFSVGGVLTLTAGSTFSIYGVKAE